MDTITLSHFFQAHGIIKTRRTVETATSDTRTNFYKSSVLFSGTPVLQTPHPPRWAVPHRKPPGLRSLQASGFLLEKALHCLHQPFSEINLLPEYSRQDACGMYRCYQLRKASTAIRFFHPPQFYLSPYQNTCRDKKTKLLRRSNRQKRKTNLLLLRGPVLLIFLSHLSAFRLLSHWV